MANNVKLNHAGIQAILNSGPVSALVNGAAEQIAANVRAQGQTVADGVALPVTVTPYTTSGAKMSSRPAASVALAHPAGIAVQAKHGSLTRAASEAGLDVR